MIFTGRLRTWLKAHPVQGHLCQGLVSLERLATYVAMLPGKESSRSEQFRYL